MKEDKRNEKKPTKVLHVEEVKLEGDVEFSQQPLTITEDNVPELTLRDAMAMVVLHLKEDADMRMTWGTNFAQCVMDAFGKPNAAPVTKDKINKVANDAANRFIEKLIRSVE